MRYDRLQVKAVQDENSFIRDTPVLTRTGFFVYMLPDGTKRREYRPPDEVFKADSLNAFAGIPITDEHHGEIKSNNAKVNNSWYGLALTSRLEEEVLFAAMWAEANGKLFLNTRPLNGKAW